MATTVSVDVLKVKDLAKKLNSYSLSNSERQSLLRSLGLEIEEQTKERIEHTKTAPDGSPWAEVSEITRRYAYRGSTLFRSGYLLQSIESQVSSWQVLVGATREYAAVHQFGVKRGDFGTDSDGRPIPWADIPARPYLGLGTDDISELEEITEQWLRSHVK